MGYFAQQALDLLDPDLTIEEQLREGLSARVDRRAAQSRRRLPVLRRRHRQEDPRAVGRREDAARDGADAARPAELPGARRADQPSRSGDQGDAARRRCTDFDGTMLFVSHDRAFLRGLSNRVLELGGESGTDAQAAPLSGLLRRVRRAHRPRSARSPQLTAAIDAVVSVDRARPDRGSRGSHRRAAARAARRSAA